MKNMTTVIMSVAYMRDSELYDDARSKVDAGKELRITKRIAYACHYLLCEDIRCGRALSDAEMCLFMICEARLNKDFTDTLEQLRFYSETYCHDWTAEEFVKRAFSYK